MTPEEKRARRRERDRAAYARDPEKFRKLSRENRLKPGAAERHKEYVKAWALRNVLRGSAPVEEIPARGIVPTSGRLTFLVDRAAAAGLGQTP